MTTSKTYKNKTKPMIVKVCLKSKDSKSKFGAMLGFYKVTQVAPPNQNFNYWTIWYKDNKTEEDMVQFFRESSVESLSIEGGENEDGTVRNS